MTDQNAPEEGMKQLREAHDAEKTRADAAEQALRGLKAEVVFEKSGLTSKHAELFLKSNPEADVTPDNVKAFADEYGLAPASGAPAQDPPKETKPPADAGLAALTGAAQSDSGGAAPAAQPQISVEDFEQLLADNPGKAAELYVKGQVPRNAANTQARKLVEKGVIDH